MRKKKSAKIIPLLGAVVLILIAVAFITRKTNAPGVHTKADIAVTPETVANMKSDPKPTFNKQLNSLDDPASPWVVVNKTRPLNPKDYVPADLVSVGGGQQMRSEAVAALKKLQTGASAQGLTISAMSGYRSYATQVSVYGNEVKNYGQAKADSESARPGTSEHQTGWAVDVGGGGCGIEDCFGATKEGKWLAAHAYEYGFIIRYTTEKQSVTGYRAEPWHIRYVGSDLSIEMHDKNITTLEEFFGLPAAPDYPKS